MAFRGAVAGESEALRTQMREFGLRRLSLLPVLFEELPQRGAFGTREALVVERGREGIEERNGFGHTGTIDRAARSRRRAEGRPADTLVAPRPASPAVPRSPHRSVPPRKSMHQRHDQRPPSPTGSRRAPGPWLALAVASIAFASSAPAQPEPPAPPPQAASSGPVAALEAYLETHPIDAVAEQPFAELPLDRDAAERVVELLVARHLADERARLAPILEAKVVAHDGVEMRFWYTVYGEPPEGRGRSLFFSMHGGGGTAASVNDGQWQNQKKLYRPDEGVYLVPRAPTDTWNLWHQGHIDPLFDELILAMVACEGVDPDRVYLTGYSAGGDGTFQLAPRMADRFAAAAAMAGHPNETVPDGLRNLPFALHMGAEDAAYGRNEKAREWRDALAQLRERDPGGYEHEVVLHEGKGHWMDREDAVAIPWMAARARDLRPDRIVWVQDDVTHERFYWLHDASPAPRRRLVAEIDDGTVTVTALGEDPSAADALSIRLDDELANLDDPIRVVFRRGPSADPEVVFEGTVPRTIGTAARTLAERGDPRGVFTAEIRIPDRATRDR
jgi:poly(3-hydroxybutyrate) depolymerase